MQLIPLLHTLEIMILNFAFAIAIIIYSHLGIISDFFQYVAKIMQLLDYQTIIITWIK